VTSAATYTTEVVSPHRPHVQRPSTAVVSGANRWSRFPGSPFSDPIVLVPNHPAHEPAAVRYGPLELPDGVDTLTFLVECRALRNRNTIEVGLEVAAGGSELAAATRVLTHGASDAVTLKLDGPPADPVTIGIRVRFASFVDEERYGSVHVRYVLGYASNPLNDLLNALGSDKGTEAASGSEGVPHCYSVEYFRLFAPLCEERFNFLEIGLDDATPPADAPSLKAWRRFFPNASIYGYDIEDFGFLGDPSLQVYQGSQASRRDLARFLESAGEPSFRVVLDDGSHAASHQQISLAALFPHVESEGLYIVEDLGWQPFDESPTTLEVLRGYAETYRFESPFVSDAEARYLEAAIDSVEILKPNDSEFALIRKKRARLG
jgi:hypothetical protein